MNFFILLLNELQTPMVKEKQFSLFNSWGLMNNRIIGLSVLHGAESKCLWSVWKCLWSPLFVKSLGSLYEYSLHGTLRAGAPKNLALFLFLRSPLRLRVFSFQEFHWSLKKLATWLEASNVEVLATLIGSFSVNLKFQTLA